MRISPPQSNIKPNRLELSHAGPDLQGAGHGAGQGARHGAGLDAGHGDGLGAGHTGPQTGKLAGGQGGGQTG